MTTAQERANAFVQSYGCGLGSDQPCSDEDCPCVEKAAQALRQAENEAEQRAIDRCRQIISIAIAGDNADAESMRRLLLAAFDPRWDRVASIINPKD